MMMMKKVMLMKVTDKEKNRVKAGAGWKQ